ncbi:hypothetical protein GCM10007972_18140 [Iodidimonas muriae]|uniref:DUF4129 domain-containing protein n=1 Tax=Iodidimonas muriae TaxID=261467 RepID=A0ABQ2LDY1_9PROT|nr:hypothetical protein [Iodidimonas muriae]GER07165.1 hypothetical protein JCM17843_14750 [Kordiimonadales bacterium JCM 17843]GGO12778.1 hypothetical protein GCM10007972_18140 [Iodidimonas muriae]
MDTIEQSNIDLLSVRFLSDWSLAIQVSVWVVGALLVPVAIYAIWRWISGGSSWKEFEIDQAEIGTGTGKLRLKPNMTDRQVAYAIWVELSTRKIGLPIDFEHDVIAEIYNSWHDFFGVTRELVKSIPVNKVRHKSTQKIIKLSIEVLNEGLRPHLTTWQARFRRWYENELEKKDGDLVIDPQEIQQKFPKYDELKADMEQVNRRLISYRENMRRLVMTE